MAFEETSLVASHETPATDRTPGPAKALSIGLVVWIIAGGLAVLGVFSFLQSHG